MKALEILDLVMLWLKCLPFSALSLKKYKANWGRGIMSPRAKPKAANQH